MRFPVAMLEGNYEKRSNNFNSCFLRNNDLINLIAFDRLMELLFRKRDIKQLAILRIIIGTWFFVDLVSMLVSGYVKEAYVEAEMNFAFYGFEWIKPLPGNGMYWLFVLLSIVTIGIITGYRYRLSLTVFLIGFTYVFMCDIVYTLNKFYLFLILAFVLLLTDAHKGMSLINKSEKRDQVDNWQILIFQALFALIYTLSGVSKLNPDWLLHAEPLMLFYKKRIPSQNPSHLTDFCSIYFL